MFGYIIGISLFIMTVIMTIGVLCCCIVAGRSDNLIEKMFSKRK